MTRARSSVLAAAAGLLIGLFYSFGLSYSLTRSFALDLPIYTVMGFCALVLLMLRIFFFNRWTLLAGILITGGLGFWLYRSGWDFVRFFTIALAYLQRVWAFFRGQTPLPDGYDPSVGLLLIVPISFFTLSSAARLRAGGSMLIVALSIFVTEWLLGHHEILAAMSFTGVAVAAVFAYGYARQLFLKDMSRAEENYTESDELFAEGETVKVPKASLFAVYFLLIALVASLLATALTPGSTLHFRSTAVESVFDDLVDYFGKSSQFTRKKYSFSITSLGYPSITELGGPVTLSTETALVVKGVAPSLLKGATRSYYTGRGWEYSLKPASYRFDSPLWRTKRREVFGLNLPEASYNPQPGLLYRKIELTITPYRNLHTLFSPTRPLQIRSADKSFVPYFNDAGELFPKRKLDFMSTYAVEAQQINRVSPLMADYIRMLEESIPPDPPEVQTETERYYLQLPSSLPESVRELALNISGRAESDARIDRAVAIRDYLMTYFIYTLQPDPVPAGQDFVEYFLQTRQGYCTYYATAMVVLARAAGIPARYAEGFLLTNLSHAENVYTVTGEDAHAWAELYFDGIGWIPFDATPIGPSEDSPDLPVPNSGNEEIAPEGTASPPEPDIPDVPTAAAPPPWPFFAWAAVALILLNVVLIPLHRARYAIPRLSAKFGKAVAAKIYWTGLLDLLAARDKTFRHLPGETSLHFAERIGNLVDLRTASLVQLTHSIMRIYYSEAEPTDAELELLFRSFRDAERRWMISQTPPLFAVRRILFPGKNGFRKFPGGGNLFSRILSIRVKHKN